MQPKKSVKANLERRRAIHIQLGLITALSLVLISLEWATPQSMDHGDMLMPAMNTYEPDVMPLAVPRKPKEKPVMRPTVLVPVPAEDFDPTEIPTGIDWGNEYMGEGFDPGDYFEEEEEEIIEPVHRDLVQVPAQFPGGDEAMMRWIYNNIRYPELCAELGIEGKVTAKFTISKFGKVTDIQIARSVHPDLDAEVIRVLELMPDFRPAMQNQQLVPVFMYWPVIFRLQ